MSCVSTAITTDGEGRTLILRAESISEIVPLLRKMDQITDRPVDLYLPAGRHQNIVITIDLYNDSPHLKRILGASGKTTLEGQFYFKIKGKHWNIEHVNFVRTQPYGNASGIIAFDSSERCEVRSCTFKEALNIIQNFPNAFSYFIVFREGSQNAVIDSRFEEKKLEGPIMVMHYVSSDTIKGNQHIISNNYFGPRKYTNNPSDTAMRLGGSGSWDSETSHIPLKFKVIDNTFEDYDAYYEIISVKSAGNIFRNNTFIGCNGYLCLRNAASNIIEGNKFYGKGEEGTRGVRIVGPGHVIRNNYFQDLTGTAIWLWGGSGKMHNDVTKTNPMPLYTNIEGLELSNNSIVNCGYPIQYYLSEKAGITNIPTDVVIKDNLISKGTLTRELITLRIDNTIQKNAKRVVKLTNYLDNTFAGYNASQISELSGSKDGNSFVELSNLKKAKKSNTYHLKGDRNTGYQNQQ